MSHLLKKNKDIIFYIKFFLLLIFSIIFFKTFYEYSGKKIIYFIFSIISFYLIIFSFRKKALFFETFFGIYLFLGFWFKFSLIIFLDSGFTEGVNNFLDRVEKNYDYALLVSSVGFLGFIIAGRIRELFIYYPLKMNKPNKSEFYRKNRKIILVIFFSFVVFVCFFNWQQNIYQRGLVGAQYNFIISGTVKTALLYGLSLCSAIIFFLEFLTFKKLFPLTIFLAFFEALASSLSMLSRSMFFNIGSLFFGLYKFSNKIKITLNPKFFLNIILILFILFYISVNTINYIRINIFNSIIYSEHKLNLLQNNSKSINIFQESDEKKSFLKEFNHLLIHRWVGIDAMLIVSAHKEILNYSFLKKSFKEKSSITDNSFYENSFNLKPLHKFGFSKFIKGNTLPGLIAFLFYSGSLTFLFFSMMFLSFFASILEFISFKLLSHNLLFAAVIGQTIAYRFANFGYLPLQSYLLFGSIIVIIFLMYLVKIIFRK
jgi:hypothetical protein